MSGHSAESDAETVVRVEWGVDGDGYQNERRHHDDAVAIVAINPASRSLVRRTVTTTTTEWTRVTPPAETDTKS